MLILNYTKVIPSTFTLIGIPGLEFAHFWMAFPMCSMYFIVLLGNITILFIIKTEASLHHPMYFFLSMLAFIDLVISTSTFPKILGIFWFNATQISFDDCFIQMFFIHSFSAVESGVLLAMAFDRYMAICYPLRYATILTNSIIIKIGAAAAIRGLGLMTPLTCLVKRLPYCGANVILHSYCEHMAVVKLACADTTANYVYGITAATFVVGSDSIFIAVSYFMILRAVLSLSSQEARRKAFGTCGSHICVILLFYTPALFSFYTQRFGRQVPHHVHILLADLYLLIPPMLNPLIYGMKTKQIRERVLKVFYQNAFWSTKGSEKY
ncbi:putative olfactory receptor 52P1 [Rhinatrema bivittatum]|uniref:putative olfactory receptor 52P1 n=1 Tax=Rhinatrema bivittatum TaxID=194408 RepID=UPI00112E24A6|nr:putative olfactory receptor 52P1 [Rhinatrema bivittatum]